MRSILSETQIETEAKKAIAGYFPQIVREVQDAITKNEWVVVGMSQNPVVGKARKFLDEKGIKFHYIEHGSYLSKWKERLAIKMWSGWPTFPQVFHKGQLVGGFDDLKKYPGVGKQ
jgi:monothiol glutaredoxin